MQPGGELGPQVAEVAREAFVHAMSWGSIVVACIAGVGALIAWRYLPARAPEELPDEGDSTTDTARAGNATAAITV